MIRINRALDARLVALRKGGDKGFTLIEQAQTQWYGSAY